MGIRVGVVRATQRPAPNPDTLRVTEKNLADEGKSPDMDEFQ